MIIPKQRNLVIQSNWTNDDFVSLDYNIREQIQTITMTGCLYHMIPSIALFIFDERSLCLRSLLNYYVCSLSRLVQASLHQDVKSAVMASIFCCHGPG